MNIIERGVLKKSKKKIRRMEQTTRFQWYEIERRLADCGVMGT